MPSYDTTASTSYLLRSFLPLRPASSIRKSIFITFHRDKRSKRQIASALDEIKGIGEKTKSTLLKEFKSVKRIREASAEELAAVVEEAKAKIIQTYFSEK